MVYDLRVRNEAVALVVSGASVRRAAAELGVGHSAVHRWCRDAGVAPGARRDGRPMPRIEAGCLPRAPRSSPRSRLTYADRVLLADRLAAGASCRAVAAELGFSHTTISREVARGRGPDGSYLAAAAEASARERASRPRSRRLDREPRLRAEVVRRLAMRWSPEQVSASLARDFPGEGAMRLSHESIYRALYVQGRGSLREELCVELVLRSGRSSRRGRRLPPDPRGRRTWAEGAGIALRPPSADSRAVPGHWEGDLVLGSDGASCLVTLVERSTRFLLASRLDAHAAETVASRLAAMVSRLPAAVARTLTWDQGTEMARWRDFADATGFEVYFCDPRSPWQRGSNENANGLLRQFFPKGTDFSLVGDAEVAEAQDLLNGRPRKTLGWRTPAEAMAEALGEGGATMP